MTVLLDQVVMTDYGLFYLTWEAFDYDGDLAPHFAGQQNGWVGAALPGMLFVCLARRAGGSAVKIELLEARPQLDATGEDCVEVSVTLTDDREVWWSGFTGMDAGAFDLPGGTYRLRVTARGRDAGHDGEFEDEVVDSYLLQLWSAPVEHDEIVRTGSTDARYWNDAWGTPQGETAPTRS
ncbi:hypothetical protein C5E10_11325 [Pseudoclavibacter sp. RFBG4]|uniref:hypothetical protein n=2 Tax=unclassified Pseudoclavibacter TaxID=2615177 RepID=UPI000CE909E3|nr:hypothetical protein [Pseudoclavibacter sp. RFBG4]PPG31531.1 hypothetical protein C5E10_11325 [Pseudoclavibacter sp. RFBG4]